MSSAKRAGSSARGRTMSLLRGERRGDDRVVVRAEARGLAEAVELVGARGGRGREAEATRELGDDANVLADHVESRPQLGLRSEEHTSELQSRPHLVCRLLLEK